MNAEAACRPSSPLPVRLRAAVSPSVAAARATSRAWKYRAPWMSPKVARSTAGKSTAISSVAEPCSSTLRRTMRSRAPALTEGLLDLTDLAVHDRVDARISARGDRDRDDREGHPLQGGEAALLRALGLRPPSEGLRRAGEEE